jgi:cell division septation protein DedD
MIGPFLHILLNQHSKVAVPGLGVFYASYKPAELQFAGKSILPPDRTIEFNQRAKSDGDSFLASFIARHQNIELAHAEELIAEFVQNAKHSLQQDHRFDMGDIGSLGLDVEGNVHFFAPQNCIFSSESFGLKPLIAETVYSKTRIVVEREVPVIPLHPFDDADRDEEGVEEKSQPTGLRWGAFAAVAAAFVMTLSGVYMLSGLSQERLMSDASKPTVRQEAGLVPVPEQTELITESAVKQVPPVVKAGEITEIASPAAVVEAKTYFVIAGSFKESARLEKRSAEMQQKGFHTSFHANSEKGLTRLAIGSFENKEKAVAFLHSNQTGFTEQLWVLAE